MMEHAYIFWIIFLAIICLGAIALIVKQMAKKAAPPLRKTPAQYVSVSSEEQLDDSFLKAYELDWKPGRDLSRKVPEEIMKVVDDIEAISPMVTELSSRLNDPDIDPKEISKVIITDQGLTSFILKRVNSPFYRLAQKVDNIFSAIVILGYNEIYRIVVEERTSRIGIRPTKEEWAHANITSTIAAYLASVSRLGTPGGTMVTLGMLHDIAKTIMRKSLPQPEVPFSPDPRERVRQEIDFYGIDHASLGAYLARQWKMPEKLSSIIEKHHWPMYWPLREVGHIAPDVLKEVSILSISDIAAKNFLGEISGIYIGDDYYRYIKKQAKMENILTTEITRDLNRIKRMAGMSDPEATEDSSEDSSDTTKS
jgi:putative nucleotidyltransferase with HDIG domain